MQKSVLFLVSTLLLLSVVSAADVSVKTDVLQDTFILGLWDKPVVANLSIMNNAYGTDFLLYNLGGYIFEPRNAFFIESDKSRTVTLKISPRSDLNTTGYRIIPYFVRGGPGNDSEQEILIKVINLEDAFSIQTAALDPETTTLTIYFKNTLNMGFSDVSARFDSPFFSRTEQFTLAPYEEKQITIQLNREDYKKLFAGYYTMQTALNVEGHEAVIETTVTFSQKDIVRTTKHELGWVVLTKVVSQTNEGNVPAQTEVVETKNILARLFTDFSPEPDFVSRSGFLVTYKWLRQIQPGDALEVRVKTNWLIPVLLIFFIVTITTLVRTYSRRSVVIGKRVTFLRAKGGEFALKVTLVVKAEKDVSNVTLIDRLPLLTQLHESFSGDRPTHIDQKNHRVTWNLGVLGKGETRVLSYVLYSKVGVLGRFALPKASATYDLDGTVESSHSNTTFFVATQRDTEL